MQLSSVLTHTAFAGIFTAPFAQLSAWEVATGAMLGRGTEQANSMCAAALERRGAAPANVDATKATRGSLALVRVTQGLFDDEWLRERPFDPDGNTVRLIAQLDLYRQHGIAGVVVSLGSNPGYSQERNGVSRGASADLGGVQRCWSAPAGRTARSGRRGSSALTTCWKPLTPRA